MHHSSRQRSARQSGEPERRAGRNRLQRWELLEEPECGSESSHHIEKVDAEASIVQEIVALVECIIGDYIDRYRPEPVMQVDVARGFKCLSHARY